MSVCVYVDCKTNSLCIWVNKVSYLILSYLNDLNGIANAAVTGVSQRIDVVIGSFEMSRQPTCVLCGPIYLFVLVFYVMLFYFVFEGIV